MVVNIQYYRITARGKYVTVTDHQLILQLMPGHMTAADY